MIISCQSQKLDENEEVLERAVFQHTFTGSGNNLSMCPSETNHTEQKLPMNIHCLVDKVMIFVLRNQKKKTTHNTPLENEVSTASHDCKTEDLVFDIQSVISSFLINRSSTTLAKRIDMMALVSFNSEKH